MINNLGRIFILRLVQFVSPSGARHVGVADDASQQLQVLNHTESVYVLARAAILDGISLADSVAKRLGGETVDYAVIVAENRLLPPVDHPDPAHCYVTGTGLTHLGSAATRDSMHVTEDDDKTEEHLSDSMKMFRWGVDGGKPAPGEIGVQPEWFYKGDGSCVVAPGAPLTLPSFALDGGEEPEVTGIYIVGDDGMPYRIGFAIGNEYSDHITERQNYLYLAHSKLRTCSFGPEVLLGSLPNHIHGTSKIVRDGKTFWEKDFVSGEDNMSHWISNLEYHHFKYGLFRRPGDLHVHFFGTATLSVADGITPEVGDVFEMQAEGFGRPLANPLAREPETAVEIKML